MECIYERLIKYLFGKIKWRWNKVDGAWYSHLDLAAWSQWFDRGLKLEFCLNSWKCSENFLKYPEDRGNFWKFLESSAHSLKLVETLGKSSEFLESSGNSLILVEIRKNRRKILEILKKNCYQIKVQSKA